MSAFDQWAASRARKRQAKSADTAYADGVKFTRDKREQILAAAESALDDGDLDAAEELIEKAQHADDDYSAAVCGYL